jgi:hypothetical protein
MKVSLRVWRLILRSTEGLKILRCNHSNAAMQHGKRNPSLLSLLESFLMRREAPMKPNLSEVMRRRWDGRRPRPASGRDV